MRSVLYSIAFMALMSGATLSAANIVVAEGCVQVTAGKADPSALPGLRCLWTYNILVRNTAGRAIAIPTKGFSVIRNVDGGRLDVVFRWSLSRREGGGLLVFSASDFGFVTLYPGESAQVRIDANDKYSPEWSSINLTLEVTSEFASRYGVISMHAVVSPLNVLKGKL